MSIHLERENARFKDTICQLKKENKELHSLLSAREDEKEANLALASPSKTFSIKASPSVGGNQATAIWVASDWHVGETVKSHEVSGLNRFNQALAKERAIKFFKNGLRITTVLGKDIPIKQVVIGLLGDFITGRIHEECIETCSLRPVDEALFAKELLASGIEYLLANSPYTYTFICCCGNHSRMTAQVHSATEAGNSLETFIYHSLAKQFEKQKRVRFIISGGYHTYLKVYDMTLRFHHGHAIRYGGGIGGLFIPAFKAISQWNKARWADLDVYG